MVAIKDSIEKRVNQAVGVLSREQSVAAVYVFGSQVNGKPDKWSDIDVAVFIDGAENMGLQRRAQLSAMVQREAGDEIELHFLSKRMLDHPAPASFAKFVVTTGSRLQ